MNENRAIDPTRRFDATDYDDAPVDEAAIERALFVAEMAAFALRMEADIRRLLVGGEK